MSIFESWLRDIDREAERLSVGTQFGAAEIKAVMVEHGSAIGKAALVLAPACGMQLGEMAKRLRLRLGEVIGVRETTDDLRKQLLEVRAERDELYAEVTKLRGEARP